MLARQLIDSLAAPFVRKKCYDWFQERQKALIEAKLQGQEVATVPQPKLAPVIDLMEALKKSLGERQALAKKPAAASVPAVAEMKKAGKRSAAGRCSRISLSFLYHNPHSVSSERIARSEHWIDFGWLLSV